MHPAITKLENEFKKKAIPAVRSGDTVRLHQLIREGSKQRTQIFEGVVIRTYRLGEVSASITVRRIASGVGVEKTYLLHSPNLSKVEVIRRARVRRNFLSFLRARRGKSARLQEAAFDREAVNVTAVKDDDIEDPLSTEDESVTEIEEEDIKPDVSIDEVAKDEEKQASADEPEHDPDAKDDEGLLPKEEAEAGVDKAEREIEKEAENA